MRAKPFIDTEMTLLIPKKSVRVKKTMLMDEGKHIHQMRIISEKKTEIERENRILLEKIT